MIAVPALAALAIPHKVIAPANGVPPVGPYSPGLEAGGYVYVSGQGVRNSQSQMPEGIEAQTRQCVENVKGILQAAGLSFDQVVSVQLFVSDLRNLPVVEKIYTAAFTKNPPRITLGVARMPTDTTVEITVVAKRDDVKADRIYLPGVYGKSSRDAEASLRKVLKQSKLSEKNLLFANRYVVGGTAGGEVPVNALPGGATHAIFAMAAKTPPENLGYCEVQASDPAGTAEEQTANVFGKLKTCLAAKGLSLDDIVATNVYIDDIDEFAKMNGVYATYFPSQKPTRTTIQPLPPAKKGSLVRISALAAK